MGDGEKRQHLKRLEQAPAHDQESGQEEEVVKAGEEVIDSQEKELAVVNLARRLGGSRAGDTGGGRQSRGRQIEAQPVGGGDQKTFTDALPVGAEEYLDELAVAGWQLANQP